MFVYYDDLILGLAWAIAKQEGYFAGRRTRARRNNNPGNIWDGWTAGKKRRIWPRLPIDAGGFIRYPSAWDGWRALCRQLTIKAGRGETLAELVSAWAPPHENDTARYIANVAAWLAIPADEPLIGFLLQVPRKGGL